MTRLSDFLNLMRDGRSVDAMVEAAWKDGHDINRATVYRYLKGDEPKNPPEPVLQALASAFRVDVRDLRVLAGRPAGELGPYEPPSEAARLSKEQRAALDQLIKAIVRPAKETSGNEDKPGEEPTKREVS